MGARSLVRVWDIAATAATRPLKNSGSTVAGRRAERICIPAAAASACALTRAVDELEPLVSQRHRERPSRRRAASRCPASRGAGGAVEHLIPCAGRRRALLSPALAAAKARGVRDRRACDAPARPAVTPVPAPPPAVELCALLDAAARARGAAHGVDFRRYASCRALLAALHRAARVHARGRPVSGTVRSSWGWLARLVDELLAWEQEPDHVANADRRRSSLRRWLRELEACGLVRATIVYDDEGQERGVDVELRPVPELEPEQLERASRSAWRAGGRATATASSSPPAARARSSPASSSSAARPRRASRRRRGHASRCSEHFWPPPDRAPLATLPVLQTSPEDCEASCGARERAQWPRVDALHAHRHRHRDGRDQRRDFGW